MIFSEKHVLETAVLAVKDLLAAGSLDIASSNKQLLSIAHKFAQIGEVDSAIGIVVDTPDEYFSKHHVKQMEEDQEFLVASSELLRILTMSGYSDDSSISGEIKAKA